MSGLRLYVGEARVRLERVSRSASRVLAEVSDLADLDAGIAAVAQSVRGVLPRRICWLVLERPLIQVRTSADFPPVPPRLLRAAVRAQPERYFRAVPGGLITAATWVDEGGPGSAPVARLVAADAAVVSRLIQAAAASGLEIQRVVPADLPDRRIDLMPDEACARLVRRGTRRAFGWGALLAGLWLVAGAVAAVQLDRDRDRLGARIALNEAGVESVRRVRLAVEEIERIVAATDSLRSARGELIGRIADLATAIPATATVELLDLSADSVVLAGSALSPSLIVAAVSQVSGIDSVRLAPPRPRVVGGSPSTTGPFQLTMIRSRPK